MFFKQTNKLSSYKYKDENDAIKELSSGSVEAFNFLYEKYYNNLYSYCFRMLGDSDLAKDAYQDIFIKIYKKRKEFKGDRFSPWLFTIARNTCLNIMRTRKCFSELDENIHTTDNLRNSDFEMKELIQDALMKLPVAYREVLIMREYENCSYQEMSQILNINLTNVKVRVHRARILMRKILAPVARDYFNDTKFYNNSNEKLK